MQAQHKHTVFHCTNFKELIIFVTIFALGVVWFVGLVLDAFSLFGVFWVFF